ncbi:maleylpyruvate isomerase family mycothiol-dependent enzyme [Arsenicicoccus sp. oral taxon 190]|uniref:maleylpyruvate isomerase family mycothiol-dependent enzyme n=1 Tax=Arsenicicoccus sp. oral taxon 190 TaxID=1658671 RepID=UPI000679ED64|nr:maleylpyruvate isomerase family mycothiol-dependent enzyme [Arsenicicoccus sp. oral taxon 190]AKT50172.1 hypothetical protein ADJ73_00415 [Arsenicicoccus sp. oral taxon 190]
MTTSPATDPNPTLASWRQHAAPFTDVVEAVTDWDAASPCEGWAAADVVAHVVDTERDFLGGQGLDLPAQTGDSPAERWAAHEAAVSDLLADPAVADRTYDGHFGPTTVGATLARFYGFDLLVHRWDLARSQGRDASFTDAELDEIDAAVDGFGEHAYAPGIFARPVEVPDGADRVARVLARTGRRA